MIVGLGRNPETHKRRKAGVLCTWSLGVRGPPPGRYFSHMHSILFRTTARTTISTTTLGESARADSHSCTTFVITLSFRDPVRHKDATTYWQILAPNFAGRGPPGYTLLLHNDHDQRVVAKLSRSRKQKTVTSQAFNPAAVPQAMLGRRA